jgi:uncharacterized protein (TIGR02099 family)
MTPTPTEPRIRKARLRVVLPWLLASVFLLLALYALGGRLVTSRIAGNEAMLGTLLSDALGLEVELDRAEGRFLGWHPVLEMERIRLAPAGAAPAIRVGRMQLELDVVESLFRGHPVASTLVLEDVRVDLARGPDGGWRLREGRGGLAPDIEPIVSFLYHSDAVDLRRSRVDFHPPRSERVAAEPGRVTRLELDGGLINERGSHRGHLRVTLDSAAGTQMPATGEMHLAFAGNPLTRATRAGEVLVDLENVRLATLTGTLPARRPLMHGVLDRLRLRARIDPVDGVDLAARASAARLDAGPVDPVPLRNVRLDVEGFGLTPEQGNLAFRKLHARVGDRSLTMDGAQLGWYPDGASRDWHADLPGFDSEATVALALTLDMLGDRGNRWLASLDPDAEVRRARLHYGEADGEMAIALGLRDLDLQGFRGVPTIRGADADIVLHRGGGWIDLDSGPFFLGFPDVFREGWSYQSGRGRIGFRFEDEALHLLSDGLRIRGSMGTATARFGLYLPPEPAQRRITLMIGVRDADVAYTEAFLPDRLDPGVRSWLAGAVRAGRVERGAVLVHGDILPTERRTRSSALWFDLRDARVAFAEQWPTASSVHGRIVAEVDGVRGRLTEARLAGIRAGATRLALLPLPSGGRELRLNGVARGDGAALLDFLRQAPLGETLDFLDSDWAASGPVDLSWLLRLPLGQPVRRLEVDADLALTELRIPPGRLDLADLRGRVGYRHPGRLVADDLEGRLFGGDLRASMAGALGSGSQGLVIDLDGTARGRDLAAWLDVRALSGLGGAADYSGRVELGAEGAVRLGMKVESPRLVTGLPMPLDAPEAPLSIRMETAAAAPIDVSLDWGGIGGRFLLEDGRLEQGMLALGTRAVELPATGLSIRGEAEHLDVGAWLEVIRRMEDEAIVRDAGASSVSTLLELDLQVAKAGWGQLEFGSAGLRLDGSPRAFRIDFDTRRVEGRVRRFEGDRPMELILDRLQLPLGGLESPATAAGQDPERPSLIQRLTADLDTVDMPDMDVTIRAFSLDGEDLGRAAFELRPDPDGLRLESIDAAGRGLVFEADEQGRARVDMRLVPTPVTRVAGRLSGEDAVSVLERWGYAPTVEAEQFAFDLDLAWPGPLDRPDPLTLDGTIDLDVERGRFVQIESGTGPLRVAGLFNFAALARRLRFDFTDLYRKGIAFEQIRGTLAFREGVLETRQPVRIEGPSSSFELSCDLELESMQLDGELIVTLPVSSNLPWYAAYAALVANPLAGAGVFVAERLFRDQIQRVSSARYRISGPVDQPEVTFDTIFENRMSSEDDAGGAEPSAGADVEAEKAEPSAEPPAAGSKAADRPRTETASPVDAEESDS